MQLLERKKCRKANLEERDEVTLMVSEKRRVSCICTSSSVLLLMPATPTPLLPKDPTASTIVAD